jgi:hypothetical protein
VLLLYKLAKPTNAIPFQADFCSFNASLICVINNLFRPLFSTIAAKPLCMDTKDIGP